MAPATDLYEAIRCWYARRNATGHYGRFDTTDARQQGEPWFSRAQQTLPGGGAVDAWLMTFERLVALVLNREPMTVGGVALQ